MISGLKKTLVYDDVAGYPADGRQYELLQGELHMPPAHGLQHQWTRKKRQRQLETNIEVRRQGHVFDAPVDMMLTSEDVVQSDFVVVTERARVTSRATEASPTLLVEVPSPSSAADDRSTKSLR